jgi:hypothetical protein
MQSSYHPGSFSMSGAVSEGVHCLKYAKHVTDTYRRHTGYHDRQLITGMAPLRLQALMDLHHGNNFAKDFLADDGMAEVVYYACSIFADCKAFAHL